MKFVEKEKVSSLYENFNNKKVRKSHFFGQQGTFIQKLCFFLNQNC